MMQHPEAVNGVLTEIKAQHVDTCLDESRDGVLFVEPSSAIAHQIPQN